MRCTIFWRNDMNAQTAFGDWSTWSAPLTELQQINQQAAEKVVRECISFYSDNAATAVKCAQTMQRVSTPEDFFQTQMRLLSQQGEKNMHFLQSMFEIWQDAIKEQGRWTEDKVSTVVRKTTNATKRQSSDD